MCSRSSSLVTSIAFFKIQNLYRFFLFLVSISIVNNRIGQAMRMRLAFILMLLPGVFTLASAQHNLTPLGDTVKVFAKQKKVQHDSSAAYVRINSILITGNKRTLK